MSKNISTSQSVMPTGNFVFAGQVRYVENRKYYLYVAPGRLEWRRKAPSAPESRLAGAGAQSKLGLPIQIKHRAEHVRGVPQLVGAPTINRTITYYGKSHDNLHEIWDSAGEKWIVMRAEVGFVSTAFTHL